MLKNLEFDCQKLCIQCAVLCVSFLVVTGQVLVTNDKRSQANIDYPSVDTDERWRPYYIAHACEWTFLSLDCPMGRVLNVARTTYGRLDLTYCPEMAQKTGQSMSTLCMGSHIKSQNIVSKLCNGKSNCQVPVYNGLFGMYCPETLKYLEVYYACVDAGQGK